MQLYIPKFERKHVFSIESNGLTYFLKVKEKICPYSDCVINRTYVEKQLLDVDFVFAEDQDYASIFDDDNLNNLFETIKWDFEKNKKLEKEILKINEKLKYSDIKRQVINGISVKIANNNGFPFIMLEDIND